MVGWLGWTLSRLSFQQKEEAAYQRTGRALVCLILVHVFYVSHAIVRGLVVIMFLGVMGLSLIVVALALSIVITCMVCASSACSCMKHYDCGKEY